MRGKEEKKGRGKEEKKRRKGGEKMGTKSQKKKKKIKKKKKKRSPCASFIFFLCAVVIFWINQKINMLFREKHTISTFIFMQDFFDEQIMWLLRAKIHPHPLFCNTSKILWQS